MYLYIYIYIYSNGAVFTPWSVSKRMHESWKFHSTHLHSFDETRVLFISPPIFPKNWRNYPLVVPNVDSCKNAPCSIENTSTQSGSIFHCHQKDWGEIPGNSDLPQKKSGIFACKKILFTGLVLRHPREVDSWVPYAILVNYERGFHLTGAE